MRRQITLLVAATTSVVLLAFLVPAATLVSRVAASRALDAGQQQVQVLIPSVALAGLDDVRVAVEVAVASGRRVAVVWTDGTVLGDRSAVPDGPVGSTAAQEESTDGTRLVQPVGRADGGTATLSVLVPEEEQRAGVTRSWAVLAGLGVLLFLLALLLADRLARSMTRPVRRLADTADRLGAGDRDARVEPAGPPEVRAVGTALNRLAGRIDELLTAERETAADLAHRLRTPMTALRLDTDALPPGPARDRLVDDVDALDRTVDAVIAEARRSQREGLVAGCDAVAVVADRIAFWTPLAEDEDRSVTVSLPAGPLPVRLAADDLAAAVDALLGNVVAHTGVGTAFAVLVEARTGGGAVVTVADEGPGLTTAVLDRGVSGAGSSGLGLDIARRTAEASGGGLRLVHAPGTTVVLELGPPADQGLSAPR